MRPLSVWKRFKLKRFPFTIFRRFVQINILFRSLLCFYTQVVIFLVWWVRIFEQFKQCVVQAFVLLYLVLRDTWQIFTLLDKWQLVQSDALWDLILASDDHRVVQVASFAIELLKIIEAPESFVVGWRDRTGVISRDLHTFGDKLIDVFGLFFWCCLSFTPPCIRVDAIVLRRWERGVFTTIAYAAWVEVRLTVCEIISLILFLVLLSLLLNLKMRHFWVFLRWGGLFGGVDSWIVRGSVILIAHGERAWS